MVRDAMLSCSKRNKRKNKLRKKKLAAAAKTTQQPAAATHTSAKAAATAYLEMWRDQRHTWKFSKLRQSYLLRAWPDATTMPLELFDTLLPYLGTMSDGARDRVIEQASAIAQEEPPVDDEPSESTAESADGAGTKAEATTEKTTEEAAEERRARLEVRRVRALKVLAALCDDGHT
jgi:hypothetical protein